MRLLANFRRMVAAEARDAFFRALAVHSERLTHAVKRDTPITDATNLHTILMLARAEALRKDDVQKELSCFEDAIKEPLRDYLVATPLRRGSRTVAHEALTLSSHFRVRRGVDVDPAGIPHVLLLARLLYRAWRKGRHVH